MPKATPWPPLEGPDDWEAVRRDDARLAGGVRAIMERHALAGAPVRFSSGSLPVYAVGADRVLKLFPPDEADAQRTEVAALEAVDGRLAIATPSVVAAAAFDGWPYVVMTRCRGRPLRELWCDISAEQRIAVVEQIGRATADLHNLPAVPSLALDWPHFMDVQRATAQSRQAERGLAVEWRGQIDPFLASVRFPTPTLSLLHTEIMLEHVFAAPTERGWQCTGLIDFEPSMIGDRGYELASVGLFVTEGDPALFSAFLDAYALETERGGALARRCLAYVLLHRYCNLPWFLERLQARSRTLDDLAEEWFASAKTE